jgi:FSR family fosmidomycin resistance protein-like MFS transporter
MEYKKLSIKNISANLFVYGTAHAVIDAICAAVIFTILKNKIVGIPEFFSLVVVYNVFAFGLQAGFGLIVDYFKSPRAAALLGCVFTGISALVFLYFPIMAIIFAGVGNALFHIGGGSISLNLTPQKASAPGIYVAPGALGLFIGTMLGKNGQFIVWPFILLLILMCFLMLTVKKPEMDYEKERVIKNKFNYFEAILLLIFLSVAVRSLVGFVIVFPWKSDISLLVVLTFAVVLGKGLGGIMADKFGWIRVAVGALLLSIPFLVFGASNPYLAITGMFLFNMTMPVTLVALSNILPGRPAFAFGLTCLALILGAIPVFTGSKSIFNNTTTIFTIIFISAVALYIGLQLLSNKKVFIYNKEVNKLT